MFTNVFHQSLAQARKSRAITLRSLAVCTGLAPSRLSRLERGERAPTWEERSSLAAAFPTFGKVLLSAAARPLSYHRKLKANSREFLDSQRTYSPPSDRGSLIRYRAAGKIYPGHFCRLVNTIFQREDLRTLSYFCSGLAIGSSLECMFVLRLLAEGAVPAECAPSTVPFALPNPVVCPETREPVGHRAFPCFRLGDKLWFPQVTFSTPRLYTVDFLVCSMQQGWEVVEIDGRGHDSAWDTERTRALALSVLRLNEEQVLGGAQDSLRAA